MNKFSTRRLAALLLSVGVSSAFIAGVAQAQSDTTKPDDQATTLEAVDVTGSHLGRIEGQGPNPVTTFSASDLSIQGFSTVGDALRSLPFINGESMQPAASNNSFTPGASTVNFRGLGNNNVLVLIDGRRSAPYSSPGFNGLQTVFDFNSIPEAAVESIEILKDGGSAIYGADAVSGVINIKLKKTYNGLSTSVEFGNTTQTDSLERKYSAVMGVNDAKNSIIVTVDYSDRASIKDRDYFFSRNADATSRGGNDLRSYAGYPGLVYVDSLEDYYTLAAPKVNPTLGDFSVADLSHGSYNFQAVTDQTPEVRNYGFYSRLQHDFNPNLYGYAEISYRRSEAVIGAAPTPLDNFNEHGDGANGFLSIPSTNPNNPFGEDLSTEWYARLVSAGNRVNDVTSETPRVLVGLGGKIGQDWVWDSGAMISNNKTINLNGGTAFDDLYQQALNGVVIDGQTLYANPFGPEDPKITAYYTHNNPDASKFDLRTFDFSTSGPIFQLPAGPLGLAVGGEYRTEELNTTETADNITGNIIGGAQATDISGSRRVYAAYAELGIPIVKGLQAQIAARYEHYSDFGSATKPKFALSYQPVEWLRLRASFGQSFLAPNLAYLYSSAVTTFSDEPEVDPKRPNDAPRQLEVHAGGNPNLKPEDTNAYYAGFQIEPKHGFLKGFSLYVDYLEFKQKNLIGQLGDAFILQNEDVLPGKVVRNAAAAGQQFGVINYLVDTYTNTDNQNYSGIDAGVHYDYETASYGLFHLSADTTLLRSDTVDGAQQATTYEFPRWRSTYSLDWAYKDWGAAIFIEQIGRFQNFSGPGYVASQTIVNPQVYYKGLWKSKITVGARNIFDKDPPFDANSAEGWDPNTSDPGKLFVYVKIDKDW